jgi:catechol 2,3-dioxygenase-like lactoylglutathione lyase family enzyme
MLTGIHPKLPMRNKAITEDFYLNKLGFHHLGTADFEGYLMVQKDEIEIHFFEFAAIDPKENYGQVYIRTNDIDTLYRFVKEKGISCTDLEHKPWMQREFSLLDPDSNLLTFGQSMF